MKNKTVWICDRCGSDNVYFDAYVSVNHRDDIRVYDATFCDGCQKATTISELELENK